MCILALLVLMRCTAIAEDAPTSETLINRTQRVIGEFEWDLDNIQHILPSEMGAGDTTMISGSREDAKVILLIDDTSIVRLTVFSENELPCLGLDDQRSAAARESSEELFETLETKKQNELRLVKVVHPKNNPFISVVYAKHAGGIPYRSQGIRILYRCDTLVLSDYWDTRTNAPHNEPKARKSENELFASAESEIPRLVELLYYLRKRNEPYIQHNFTLENSVRAIVQSGDNELPFIETEYGATREAQIYSFKINPQDEHFGIQGNIQLWMDVETSEVLGGTTAIQFAYYITE